jgi:hypothetical protein
MQTIIAAALALFLMISSVGCSNPTEERFTDYKNGQYKIEVRSQEFHHSAIRNVDICVAQIDAQNFPGEKRQCFLHGFDFSGLSVRWLSDNDVEIIFDCGRVTSFSNFAVIAKNEPLPVEFHAGLIEKCNRYSSD